MIIAPDLFFAFAAATAVLILIPGPVVTLTVANSLSYGTRHGLRTVFGTSCASAVLMTVGGLGMASAFALLAEWFEWVRWAGAAYLIYIGVQQWRAKPHGLEMEHPDQNPPKSLFWQGFVVSITNPKTIFFYAAFFPQFIDPSAATGPQLMVLSVTFLVIATSIDSLYALLSGRLRHWLTGERRGKIRNQITGMILIGTGLGLLLVRRT